MKENELDKKIRAEALGEKIKLLFMFVIDMKKDKDLLAEAKEQANDRANFAMSAAPLFGAVGMDYESANFEANLHERRAGAILNLLNVLEETENERNEEKEKSVRRKEAQDTIRGIMGF